MSSWSSAAVVFDCDGLLLETESRWAIAERAAVERWGGRWGPDVKEQLLGCAVPEAGRVIARLVGAPEAAAPEIAAALDEGFSRALAEHGCTPMPGAAELARGLRDAGVPIAVASNTRKGQVEEALAAGGLIDVFDVVVSAGDSEGDARVLEPKPAPDVYMQACGLLGVEASEALALEDSQTGIDAARAAGMRVIGVPSLPGQTLDADAVVSSLATLSPRDIAGVAR